MSDVFAKRSLLIVEDNADLVESYDFLLRELFDIDSTKDTKNISIILSNKKYDVIMLDLINQELIDELLKISNLPPIVVSTAKEPEVYSTMLGNLKVSSVITKPQHIRVIIDKLYGAIHGK